MMIIMIVPIKMTMIMMVMTIVNVIKMIIMQKKGPGRHATTWKKMMTMMTMIFMLITIKSMMMMMTIKMIALYLDLYRARKTCNYLSEAVEVKFDWMAFNLFFFAKLLLFLYNCIY